MKLPTSVAIAEGYREMRGRRRLIKKDVCVPWQIITLQHWFMEKFKCMHIITNSYSLFP